MSQTDAVLTFASKEEFWRHQNKVLFDGNTDMKVTKENLAEEEKRRQVFHGYSHTWAALPDDELVPFTIDESATWPSLSMQQPVK
jgi:hypothetical protein